MQENLATWLFTGGSVAVPKRLLGLMDPLGIDFDTLGRILYLLYLEDEVDPNDQMAQKAITKLANQGLIAYAQDRQRVDFSPLFQKIEQMLGAPMNHKEDAAAKPSFAELITKIQRKTGQFVSPKEEKELILVGEQYQWDTDWLYEVYMAYKKNYRNNHYAFSFFARVVREAGISTPAELGPFLKQMDFFNQKVAEILKNLGKYNYPSEPQKDMYRKWTNDWGFTHSMILYATKWTVNANNPSFSYLDKILEDWKKRQWFTEEQVEEAYSKQKTFNTEPRKKSSTRHVSESGYRDFSHLEE